MKQGSHYISNFIFLLNFLGLKKQTKTKNHTHTNPPKKQKTKKNSKDNGEEHELSNLSKLHQSCFSMTIFWISLTFP